MTSTLLSWLMIGTIHGEHRTSTRFGLGVLRAAIERFRPDVTLVEIPLNRFAAAKREFDSTGAITKPRVSRFPEYIDGTGCPVRIAPMTASGTPAPLAIVVCAAVQ